MASPGDVRLVFWELGPPTAILTVNKQVEKDKGNKEYPKSKPCNQQPAPGVHLELIWVQQPISSMHLAKLEAVHKNNKLRRQQILYLSNFTGVTGACSRSRLLEFDRIKLLLLLV